MNNNEKLLDEIGALDDELVPDLAPKKKKTPLKIAVTAGFLAVAAAAFFVIGNLNRSLPWAEYQIYAPYDYKSEIVIGELDPVSYVIANRGTDWSYEPEADHNSYICDDMENYSSGSPWNKTEFTELPVFKNRAFDDYSLDWTAYLPEEEMRRIGGNVAAALGLTVDESGTETWTNFDGEINALFLKCGGEAYGVDTVEITVSGEGSVKVEFGPDNGEVLSMSDLPHFKIPDQYNFTERDTSDEEAKEALAYLSERFENLLQFEDPVYDTYISLEGYMNGTRVYRVHEGSEDPVQELINYSLNPVEFHCLDGQLWYISLQNYTGISEYKGMYPIITAEKAEQLLLSGSYLTNVPQSFFKEQKISEEDVKFVDLTYYYLFDEYFAPMYRFCVELDWESAFPESESAYPHYGEVFVPAIEGKYVASYGLMPDFTGEAADSFPDTGIVMPDGSTVSKDEATAVYGNSGEPIIEFDFAFMRYCDHVFQSTTDDLESFDFETGEFKEPVEIETGVPKYFRVQAGDVLGNGMTVTSANTMLILKDGELGLYQSGIVIEGECVYEGVMICEREDNYLAGMYDVNFYPDTRGETPVLAIYDPNDEGGAERIVLEEAALTSSGGKFFVTNVSEDWAFEYSSIVGGTRSVKATVDANRLTFLVSNEGVYAALSWNDMEIADDEKNETNF